MILILVYLNIQKNTCILKECAFFILFIWYFSVLILWVLVTNYIREIPFRFIWYFSVLMWKPTLLSAEEAECEKKIFLRYVFVICIKNDDCFSIIWSSLLKYILMQCASAAPKKTVKASNSIGGLARVCERWWDDTLTASRCVKPWVFLSYRLFCVNH